MRVVVVGAGVLGIATARHLQERGADVLVLDPVGPGTGTSRRGAGLVCEGMWHPTSLALVRRSMELMRQTDGTGAFRYHETGSSTLLTTAQRQELQPLVRLQLDGGADLQALTPREAAQLPRHRHVDFTGVDEVLHYPRDAWAIPRLYCEALAPGLRIERAPASLREIRADAVVVAAGVWSRALLRNAGLDAPLLAYRTQAVRYHEPTAHDVPILHDAVQGFYLRPGAPGELVAGDGTTTTPEDPAAFKTDADEAFVAASAQRVRTRFPSLAGGHAGEAWAGIDAATPDRLLLAGPHPDAPNVWILAGGNGHSFMRAPAAGESLAAMILGERPPVDLKAFDPARFRGRMSHDFVIREGYSLGE